MDRARARTHHVLYKAHHVEVNRKPDIPLVGFKPYQRNIQNSWL